MMLSEELFLEENSGASPYLSDQIQGVIVCVMHPVVWRVVKNSLRKEKAWMNTEMMLLVLQSKDLNSYSPELAPRDKTHRGCEEEKGRTKSEDGNERWGKGRSGEKWSNSKKGWSLGYLFPLIRTHSQG